MKYKAVLFDMDGTVLDTLGDLAAAVNHTLREFSMPERSIAEVAAALGNGATHRRKGGRTPSRRGRQRS